MGEVIHIDFNQKKQQVGSCDHIVNHALDESVLKYKGDIYQLKLFADYLSMNGVDGSDIYDTIKNIVNPILQNANNEVIDAFVKEFTNYRQNMLTFS